MTSLSDDRVREFLTHGTRTGKLAFVASDGRPVVAPIWFLVDIAFVERFSAVVSLDTLKATPGLGQMMVTQKGSRLSVQPVTRAEPGATTPSSVSR